jgi:hypothetical protein
MLNERDQKRILIERLVPYLSNPSTDAINELLAQSLAELEEMLAQFTTNKIQEDANEMVEAHREAMRTESQLDAAYTHAIRNVTLNGKYLTDSEANKNMLQSLLNPGEDPSPAIYRTLALQFSTKFSWEFPKVKPTPEDQRAAFNTFVRENDLSGCEANFQLFRDGSSAENFSGASGLERATRQEEVARARQHFLIHSASPTQLKQEAAWESQQNRAAAVQAEADRQHQISSQQQRQSGMFPPLPAVHAETGEAIDARWLRKTSTINFELFKKLCRKHGSAAINERLRVPATPAV